MDPCGVRSWDILLRMLGLGCKCLGFRVQGFIAGLLHMQTLYVNPAQDVKRSPEPGPETPDEPPKKPMAPRSPIFQSCGCRRVAHFPGQLAPGCKG